MEGWDMSDRREVETEPAAIEWIGQLDGGIPNKEVWRGKISASLRVIRERFDLADEHSAQDKLDELKKTIQRFYVKATAAAVVRCIDGRGEEDSVPDSSELGPQVPGGTAVTSLAYRFSKGLSA